MSSEFLPINMNRRISTEDSSYARQNQYSPNKAVKASNDFSTLPSNDDIKQGVATALSMLANNKYPDRGSILNILV